MGGGGGTGLHVLLWGMGWYLQPYLMPAIALTRAATSASSISERQSVSLNAL